ncbi:MAG: thioredoxin fold domain-containing protein [Phycisphaerales bacterium]|nr:MAG: thioredoxin fold domain-containing protein [Phycisphaerales bacterium]
MKRTVLCFVIAALPAATAASAVQTWYVNLSFEEALKKAEVEKKLVAVDFYADWCAPCKIMDATTLQDPKVVEWFRTHTIGLKVDAERDVALAARYGVDSFPTFVFLKPDGTEFDRLLGYLTPEQILPEFAGIQEGKDAVARAKDALQKGDPTDPVLRAKLASAYATKGKYEQAAAEYLWCLDEGFRKHPELGDLRGYVLTELMILSQRYPKVIGELAARRSALRKKLFEGEADEDDVFNFAAFNEVSGEPQATVNVYDELRVNGKIPARIKQALVRAVLVQLLQARRYSNIAADMDVMAAVDAEFAAAKQAPPGDEQVQLMLISVISSYYQILVALNRSDDADSVAKRLIKFADRPETYHLLAWNGYLTGKPVQANLDQARKADELTDKKNIGVIDTLARILHAMGKKDEAVAVAERGLKNAADFREQMFMQQCLFDIRR